VIANSAAAARLDALEEFGGTALAARVPPDKTLRGVFLANHNPASAVTSNWATTPWFRENSLGARRSLEVEFNHEKSGILLAFRPPQFSTDDS
jgi:hypothetical protein